MEEAKKIGTKNLKIEKNIISFGDTMLQISNVSQVSIEPIPKKKLNFVSVILLLLGIGGLIYGEAHIKFFGGIVFAVTIGYFFWLYYINSTEKKYLYLYMNSGCYYYIFCDNESFLAKAMRVIESCINDHHTEEINIDFAGCRFYDSPLIVGTKDSTVVVGNNNSVTINDAEWKVLQEELLKVYQKLPSESAEYSASRKAFQCAWNKDEQGLKKVMKEFAKSFTSDIFSGVASGVLLQWITKLIG